MHSHSIDDFRHEHIFLGEAHERNERKVWIVIAICAAMMVAEIVGGAWFGSVALIADGLHMSTHAGALLIAALAYTFARRYAHHHHLAFGTGKLGDLAAFTSAIALAMIALLIGYESLSRLGRGASFGRPAQFCSMLPPIPLFPQKSPRALRRRVIASQTFICGALVQVTSAQ